MESTDFNEPFDYLWIKKITVYNIIFYVIMCLIRPCIYNNRLHWWIQWDPSPPFHHGLTAPQTNDEKMPNNCNAMWNDKSNQQIWEKFHLLYIRMNCINVFNSVIGIKCVNEFNSVIGMKYMLSVYESTRYTGTTLKHWTKSHTRVPLLNVFTNGHIQIAISFLTAYSTQ